MADVVSRVVAAEAVYTPEPLGPGYVVVGDDGRISSVVAGPAPADAEQVEVLVPGFVDIHSHGGGGAAFTDGVDAAATVLATHRRHGTTSMLASLVTDSIERLSTQVAALAPLVRADELVGIHLEGPWLSELHCGAHDPELLRDPERGDVARVLAAGDGTVAMVTLAVERDGGLAAVPQFLDAGVRVALGHSHASYAKAERAIDAGATIATHLYNAERPFHHREPGLTLALLTRPEVVVELIADGVHLHPAALADAARRKPGQFVLITDAMAAAGVGDGDFQLGPLSVEVRDGVARLAGGGAIAGSTLTLDRALRYAVDVAGLPFVDALCAMTRTPADVFGRSDLGRLEPGAQADLVALDGERQVARVWRRGVALGG